MAYGETYEEFVEKFKPKHTTDDCVTPSAIYNAVRDWAVAEYDLEGARIVRPFFPGGDYKKADYSGSCVVIDNPPFSILSEIVDFFTFEKVRFFLFAPTLTICNLRAQKLVVGVPVTYENGAVVSTSFVTNLETSAIRTAPDLFEKVKSADKVAKAKKKHPRYTYPPELLRATDLVTMSRFGVDFKVPENECCFVSKLDDQGGRRIYGGGFLVSENMAKNLENAKRLAQKRKIAYYGGDFVFNLSEREKKLVRCLGEN